MSKSKYWEVEFPDTKMQVSGEWTKQQATDAIKTALLDFIDKHIELIEPEPELPEGIEVTFGDANKEVEE